MMSLIGTNAWLVRCNTMGSTQWHTFGHKLLLTRAEFLHCVRAAVNPPMPPLITRQSNKANRIDIEPRPTWFFDVPMNISISFEEYNYAVACNQHASLSGN